MTARLSALQRRLAVAESRPDEDWLVLVENVPAWPPGQRPDLTHVVADHAAPYSYLPSRGAPALVEAIAARERKVSGSSLIGAAHIAVTAGGMNAIGTILRDCFDAGYRKTVHAIPTFRGVRDSMAAAGLSPHAVALTGSAMDWELLAAECTEPTVLYVNLPHNPTGIVPTAEYLAGLEDFAASHDVFVLYDAVYDSFLFRERGRPAPVDVAIGHRGFTIVNSMSKNYGRPGDRIGWIVAHEQTLDRLLPRLEWEAVCVNSRAQAEAAAVIDGGNEVLLAAVETGREAYREHAAGHPVLDVPVPDGGTQHWLDLRVPDIEAFADFALDAHRLVLTTSANYAPSPAGSIRFPTGVAPELIRAGLERLGRVLADWEERS
ncbi:aspartate aminotransferase [Catenulispora sp. GP43]|uniref:beta-methylarginine biosynthesis bifunctional aminotransferase n=1 Tax=Catenulispora sp. GP43 TaxID=3156263 RepID=UPI003517253B